MGLRGLSHRILGLVLGARRDRLAGLKDRRVVWRPPLARSNGVAGLGFWTALIG